MVLVGPLRGLFNTVALSGRQWGVALGLSLVPVGAYEVWKLVRRGMAGGA